MRHRALLRRAIGVLAALALLLALPLQAGMAMPMPDHAMAPGMAMPDAEATMSSCGGCAGDDGAGMAMGACAALCGSMLALPLGLITLPTLPIERSEEHTSELQSLMRISYAVFCLKKKKTNLQIIYSKLRMLDKQSRHDTH